MSNQRTEMKDIHNSGKLFYIYHVVKNMGFILQQVGLFLGLQSAVIYPTVMVVTKQDWHQTREVLKTARLT